MKLQNKFTIFIFFIFSSTAIADYEVRTSSGVSDGYKQGRVVYWDDIPYAQPPIKELRWKAPREINNSEIGIIPKDDNYCVQRPSTLGGPGGEVFMSVQKIVYI